MPPSISNSIDSSQTTSPSQTAASAPAFSFEAADLFEDSALALSRSYCACLPDGTPIPSWLEFQADSGRFSGAPACADVGMIAIRVAASDGAQRHEEIFAILVQIRDGLPYAAALSTKPRKRSVSRFSFSVLEAFRDLQSQDIVAFSATMTNGSDLPDWLALDAKTGELAGSPTDQDLGSLALIVFAATSGATENALISLEVEQTPDGPAVRAQIEDPHLAISQPPPAGEQSDAPLEASVKDAPPPEEPSLPQAVARPSRISSPAAPAVDLSALASQAELAAPEEDEATCCEPKALGLAPVDSVSVRVEEPFDIELPIADLNLVLEQLAASRAGNPIPASSPQPRAFQKPQKRAPQANKPRCTQEGRPRWRGMPASRAARRHN